MSQNVTIHTPTGPLQVIRPVAANLLKEGVISGELDGILKATDAATVKAWMMGRGVCDFCSAPGPAHAFDVPDFEMPHAIGMSTGGWAACDACAELVRAGKREALLSRSVGTAAFPKFSRAAIKELHDRFWHGMENASLANAMAATVHDFIEDDLGAAPPELSDRDKRAETIRRAAGLTLEEMSGVLGGDPSTSAAKKLLDWHKRFGKQPISPRTLADMFDPPKKPAPGVPHWQRALDAKYEALVNIGGILRNTATARLMMDEPTDLKDPAAVRALLANAGRVREIQQLGFANDVKALRTAQAYSFNGETTAAIREAAKGLPHDAPLSSIETPNVGAGWFWFADAMELAGTPEASDKTDGLLWSWTNNEQVPSLCFAAFIVARFGEPDLRGKVLPSTKWFWPLHLSFHEMIGYNRDLHRRDYGEGGRLLRDGLTIAGEAETLRVVGELSLFFLMACLWFKQTISAAPILTKEPGHVERHARKRIQREHGLKEPPTVQVIALRKAVRSPAEEAPADRVDGAREYHCRWIVKGHPRMQACGPGRKDRKLIWIEAHPAGPDDKPLRESPTKVYAVVR